MACEGREAPDAREVAGAARRAGRAGLTQDVALAALAVALHQVGVALLSSSYHASVQCTGSFVVSLALAVALYLVVTHRPRAIADGPWALAGVLANVAGVVLVGLGIAGTVPAAFVSVGDCLRAVGGLWATCAVSLLLVDVAGRRGMPVALVGIAAGWLLALLLVSATSALSDAGKLAVIALIPAALALVTLPGVRRATGPARRSPGSAELRVTEPRSSLPVSSAVFVMFTLLKVAFCFASDFVRADAATRVPMLWTTVALAALVTLAAALAARRGRAVLGGLYRVTLACVVVGFLLYVPRVFDVAWTSVVAGVVLGTGGDLARILAYVLLMALALRNPASAPGVALVVAGINTLGTLVGTVLSDAATVLGADPLAYQLLLIGFASTLVVLNLAVPRALAFDEAVREVRAPAAPVVGVPVDVLAAAVADVASSFSLTPRETEALGLLAHGHAAHALQERMGISRNTVKMHVRNVYAKLGVHSQQELIDLVEARQRPL